MTDLFLFALMGLAAYRLTRLLVKDTFPPVLWVRDRLAGGWRSMTLKELETYNLATVPERTLLREQWSYDPHDEDQERYVMRASWSPLWLAELITCPWCASAYVSGAVVALTWWAAGVPVPFLQWLAVWAVAAVLASREEL